MEQKIKELWQEFNFPSPIKLFQLIKPQNPNITYKMIYDVLNKQEAIQINKQIRKPSEFTSIVAPSKGYNYQMDIMVYKRFRKNNYQYILTCIDVYSRRAEVEPMTNMTGETILENAKKIFQRFSKDYPRNLNTDNQFNFKEFVEFLDKHNIKLYLSYADDIIDSKNSLIERFHRTLAGMLARYRSATLNNDWYKWIDDIVQTYNNSIHRTIGCAPMEAWNGTKVPDQVVKTIKRKFKEGDLVRIALEKELFRKGDAQTFSKEIYKIIGFDKQRYVLETNDTNERLKRPYKERELTNANNFEKTTETEPEIEPEIDTERRLRREGLDTANILETRTRQNPKKKQRRY